MSFSTRLKSKFSNIGFTLIFLSVVFFILEFIFSAIHSELHLPVIMKTDKGILSSYLHTPILVLGLLYFIFGFILIRVLFVAVTYYMTKAVAYLFSLNKRDQFIIGLIIWIVAIASVLLANNYWFPFSKFSLWTYGENSVIYIASVTYCALGIFGLFVLLALCGIVKWLVAKKYWLRLSVLSVIVIGLIALNLFGFFAPKFVPVNNAQLPNVIIVGIDSLRPDFVSSLSGRTISAGPLRKLTTPNIDSILKGSTVFTNAYTIIGRTYPSWMSLLSGEYPDQSGAIFNLAPRGDTKSLLTYDLKKLGYYGVVSFDDNRFSNFDKRYGYDQVVGPSQGVNDFILATFNDFPFSNILVNTTLGKWLFPYQYANRAGSITYHTATFSDLLSGKLAVIKHRPLFLAVHFCMPHWPYYWALHDPIYGPYFDVKAPDLFNQYGNSVSQADKQVGQLLNQLKVQGILNHAILVVLSDHGESLLSYDPNMLPDSKFIPGANRPKSLIRFNMPYPLYGHGGDLNTLVQNHTLFAFRLFGYGKNVVKSVPQRVTLMDVRPTILSFLNQPMPKKLAGVSLKQVITSKSNSSLEEAPVFMETDFALVQLKNQDVPVAKLIMKGLNFYEINHETGLLQLNPLYFPTLKENKFHSIIYKNWYLIVVPKPFLIGLKVNGTRSLLVNLKTGYWTDNLASDFARKSPVVQMYSELRRVYGGAIGNDIIGLSNDQSK